MINIRIAFISTENAWHYKVAKPIWSRCYLITGDSIVYPMVTCYLILDILCKSIIYLFIIVSVLSKSDNSISIFQFNLNT